MNIHKVGSARGEETSLALITKQRSHNLYVLSNPAPNRENAFLEWYNGDYMQMISQQEKVLSAQHYERNAIDVTRGISRPFDYAYLAVYELSLDGAEQAAPLIDQITVAHTSEHSAACPTTWLYYPVSEKVGRRPKAEKPTLQLAFANAIPGTEAEFREWYATRHVRHAFNIPALVSGQCFELAGFQKPGATVPTYNTIAVYEVDGGPEDIMKGVELLPSLELLDFPSLDLERFSEWCFFPIAG